VTAARATPDFRAATEYRVAWSRYGWKAPHVRYYKTKHGAEQFMRRRLEWQPDEDQAELEYVYVERRSVRVGPWETVDGQPADVW
jgi:hypothetical protein